MDTQAVPGMLRAAHVSLFLLFLSFLNLGTRRNFALRLRLEKSDSWPCTQTHINTLQYSKLHSISKYKFTFNHLAGIFIQSDKQMKRIEGVKLTIRQQYEIISRYGLVRLLNHASYDLIKSIYALLLLELHVYKWTTAAHGFICRKPIKIK